MKMKIDKEIKDEKMTDERRKELYNYHNYIIDFIYTAYSEGVITRGVGTKLIKYQRKLIEKDKIAGTHFKGVGMKGGINDDESK